ncbi:MAG: SIS domain-containing protein [Kiritimatiellia bacterium]|jgi:D-sedoheptulose 7-phosphate isomerase|nr:SIS domain-containing protein [Kiritimatiellia bacterium]MDD4173111.1 SIS domain-containing protein [Kiritimatiellia bacterium]MDX9792082.1 SIS domain-containing protein [Kiritimatiellia bacterium]NLC83054.1 SIS domain-containing protein [Lentisphaerota bacterium]
MKNELMKDLETYAADAAAKLMATDFGKLAEIGSLLLRAKAEDRTVFLMGNGGSAATASHVTNDLVKGCRIGDAPGFRAFCLSDSNALVTCLANDFCYAEIYAILLQTYARPGDIVIAFSGSGNSPNILQGLTAARGMGLATIGFGGRDGGQMKALCDLILIAPTDSMELLEDLHLIYFHNLVCAMRPALAEQAGVAASPCACCG